MDPGCLHKDTLVYYTIIIIRYGPFDWRGGGGTDVACRI